MHGCATCGGMKCDGMDTFAGGRVGTIRRTIVGKMIHRGADWEMKYKRWYYLPFTMIFPPQLCKRCHVIAVAVLIGADLRIALFDLGHTSRMDRIWTVRPSRDRKHQ